MSTICPRCGVAIHSNTNPTCYNCLRIEQEERRFGRRLPRKAAMVPPPPPIEKIPKKKQTAVSFLTLAMLGVIITLNWLIL
jgi:hypothetical protein